MAHIAHPALPLSGACETLSSKHLSAAKTSTDWMKRVNQVADFIAAALQRRAQRRALMRLSDAALSDLGITRAQAEEEYRKSFLLR